MAQVTVSVRVEGLKQFRADLQRAENANPRELTRALKSSGEHLPPLIRAKAPKRTGFLAASVGRISSRGSEATIQVGANYAPIIEFARRGRLGATLSTRYGSPPRYGYRIVDQQDEVIARKLDNEMTEIITAYRWLR